jgi:hypothetical protein
VDTSKLSDAVETISQEILNIKEKIKSYEADLQTAKQMGDKQEVKLLREDIRTKENLLLSKESILISEKNLLVELQKEKNLLIANANIQGYYIEQHFRTSPLSLSLSHISDISDILTFIGESNLKSLLSMFCLICTFRSL